MDRRDAGTLVLSKRNGFVLIIVLVMAGFLCFLLSLATVANYRLHQHSLRRAARLERTAQELGE